MDEEREGHEVTLGQGEGRLALHGRDLSCGEIVEVLANGVWTPATVEWEPAHGWVLTTDQIRGHGADHGLTLLLHPGLLARRP